MDQKSFIQGFWFLGPSIFIQDQHTAYKEAAIHGSAGSPDLILIASWTGATAKHVSKYTRTYNDVYPQTPIMVITTEIWDLVLRSTKVKADGLAPAVTYIHRLHSSRKGSQILLHIFSDGGSNKAICLAEAYLAQTGRRLPVAAAVLDSTPGTARYATNIVAFKRSLPNNKLVRAIGLPVGAVILAVIWLLFRVFIGIEQNVISKTRRALNDVRLWDLATMTRTYIFSQADDLINWKDVEHHAAEAAETFGTTSMLVRYTDSSHCCHARDNGESYWGAVKRTWEMRDVEAFQVA